MDNGGFLHIEHGHLETLFDLHDLHNLNFYSSLSISLTSSQLLSTLNMNVSTTLCKKEQYN